MKTISGTQIGQSGLVLLLVGCAMSSPNEGGTNIRAGFLPAPFHSERPSGVHEVELDSILNRLSASLRDGRLVGVRDVIDGREGRHAPLQFREVDHTYGDYSGEKYVFTDQRFGTYLHFKLEDSDVQLFVPSICRNMINSDMPELGQFVPDAANPSGAMMYFDLRCEDNIHLRFFAREGRDQFIDSIMMYRADAVSSPSRTTPPAR